MSRYSLFLLLLITPNAQAELPVIAPQSETKSTPTTVVQESLQTPVMPISPWTVNCQPAVACDDPCKPHGSKRTGVLTNLKNWLCSTKSPTTCTETACSTPVAVAPPKTVMVPVPIRPAVTVQPCMAPCPEESSARFGWAPSGVLAARFKTWLLWKPCNEQLLPAFCPEPYQTPVSAYFQNCKEPTPGMPCGTCKKHGAGKCPTGMCATGTCATTATAPVGPIIGWKPIYANGPAPTVINPIIPASATVPAKAPAVKPEPKLITRPFTNP